MDIGKYISSGILEQYVLGDLSEKERREVERYAAQFPEIRQELDAIEAALESYALQQAIAPSAGVLGKIMARIQPGAPAPKTSALKRYTPLIIILLLLSTLIFGFLYFRQKQACAADQARLQALLVEQDSLKTQIAQQQAQGNDRNQPKTQPVYLKGTPEAPEAVALVYWNPATGTNTLDVIYLPEPPAGKQYQLWAIVDGVPADMDVFTLPATAGVLIKAPFIENPQAFAISLEPLGGSPLPTPTGPIYAVGNVI